MVFVFLQSFYSFTFFFPKFIFKVVSHCIIFISLIFYCFSFVIVNYYIVFYSWIFYLFYCFKHGCRLVIILHGFCNIFNLALISFSNFIFYTFQSLISYITKVFDFFYVTTIFNFYSLFFLHS